MNRYVNMKPEMSKLVLPADAPAFSPAENSRKPSTQIFYLFFFVSGFCSLVYEVVWLRLVVAKFGVTTPTVSIMLSVFMAGLGLGSWLGGRFIAGRARKVGSYLPLRLYAGLELLIGLSAVTVPALLTVGYRLQSAGASLEWGSASYYLLSGLWISVALLPWCTAMGATFPFAMSAIGKLGGEGSARSFSYLYLANVLGAVAGTLIPAFILIELLGFQGTLYVACALNLLLAAGVFLFSLTVPRYGSVKATDEPEIAPANASKAILAQLFATGICSMALEVVWIRQFTVYLGNVAYAFAIILALYLIATFAGSALYRQWARAGRDQSFGVAWIPLGLAALLPLLAADPRVPIAESLYLWQVLMNGATRTAIGIVPFSALAGFLTPMLVDRWSGGVPERAGRAYAVNVMGSILGPLVAGFFIVPVTGERWGLVLIALPLFALGFQASRPLGRKLIWSAAAAASALLLIFTRDYSVKFPHPVELRDHTATVIAHGEGMRKRLLVNGTGMTKLTPITKMMAHLPLAYHREGAQSGLVICMGMGTTFRSMLSWGIDATVVELVPSVPKLFSYFHPDAPQLLQSGKAHIVVDDGRRFLQRSPQQFDVMAIDPPPPIGAPTSSLLYSLEFYRTVKPHLKPDGVLQIWYPGGDDTTTTAITKAIQASFAYVRAFDSLEGWGTHYIVSEKPIPDLNIAEVVARMPRAAARDMTEFNPNWTPQKMFTDVDDNEFDVDQMAAMDRSAPAMTDNRAVNEYFLLRTMGRR